jgi:5-methylcytosine-specific restriction endonuclease McrA
MEVHMFIPTGHLRNRLWCPDNPSNKHPEWSTGSDVKVYGPDGKLKEIIPIKQYHKPPPATPKIRKEKPPHNPRDNKRYIAWRDDILRRDKRKCVLCGSKDFPNVHHVQRWVDNVKLRYNKQNGVTICMVCHNKHHGPHRKPFPDHINDILIAYLGRIYAKTNR